MTARTQPATKPAAAPPPSGILRRKCACGESAGSGSECEGCKKKKVALQRRAASDSGLAAAPPVVHEVLRSPGRPLDSDARTYMEPRFRHDFSRVRVHTDGPAARSAEAVHALAYTVGSNIVFGRGRYLPGTAPGRQLLAHELAHVVQHGGAASQAGALRSTGAGNTRPLAIGASDSEAERQACAAASAVLRGDAAVDLNRQPAEIARQPAPSATSASAPDDQTAQNASATSGKQAPSQKGTSSSHACELGKSTGVTCEDAQGSGHPAGVDLDHFAINKDEVGPADLKAVHDFKSKWTAAGSKDSVEVHGYASCDGPADFNVDLSCRRAEAVKAKLAEAPDAVTSPIQTFAHGETEEFGAAPDKNRRAIIATAALPPKPPGPQPPPPPLPPLCPKLPAATPASCTDRHNAYCEAQKCFPANPWLDCVCTASGQVCEAADAFTFTGARGTALEACAVASGASTTPIRDKGNWFLTTNRCIWGHWRAAFEAVHDPARPVPGGLTPEWAGAVAICRRDGIGSSGCCKAHVTAEQSAIDRCAPYNSSAFGKLPTDVPGAPLVCGNIVAALAPPPPFTGDFGSVGDRIKYGDSRCKC